MLDVNVSDENASSDATASAMATSIREKSDADYGLAIAVFPTSIGAPNAELSGTLNIAIATRKNVRVKGFPVASHPAIIKVRCAKQALNMLRLQMMNS
jgi:nicotinamide-nucleotide amidase